MTTENPQRQEFDIQLVQYDDGAVSFVMPFSVPDVFGTKGQVRVRGSIDGHPYRSSIAPYGGKHYLVIRRALRETVGKTAGDTVHIVMEIDTEPRVVKVPEDLQTALDSHDKAKEVFDQLSYTHRKEYVTWIEGAKKPETRAQRVEKSIERIAVRKKRT